MLVKTQIQLCRPRANLVSCLVKPMQERPDE